MNFSWFSKCSLTHVNGYKTQYTLSKKNNLNNGEELRDIQWDSQILSGSKTAERTIGNLD